MTRKQRTQAELEAYLDEDLPAAQMAEIESVLRADPSLAEMLVKLNERRDAGAHSLGAIWRRNRISCPTREQLGSFLLETLSGFWILDSSESGIQNSEKKFYHRKPKQDF